ncbi:MAG: hypothetical protein U1F59_11745 [Candidatus Competibacteraceae bacterium]
MGSRAGPGTDPGSARVLYVFRDKEAEQRFLVERYRSRRDPHPALPRRRGSIRSGHGTTGPPRYAEYRNRWSGSGTSASPWAGGRPR